jgi:hypothetical protein
MKLFVGFMVMLWLISGLAGAYMLEGSHMHLKTIAKGPISLVHGYNDASRWDPGPTY